MSSKTLNNKNQNNKRANGKGKKRWRGPTFPHLDECSIIGAEELNFRVRNGNGCCLLAIPATKFLFLGYWLLAMGYRLYFPPIASRLLPIAFIYKEG